jgi:nucleoside-triphosphatase
MLMRLRYAKTLLTGKPGVGKTTLVRKVVERLSSVVMSGFYTTEMRSKGQRTGFELQGLNGDRRILAHTDIQSRHRVAKYGVDTAGFDLFLNGLDLLNPNIELIVMDEIGQMELFSDRFRKLLSAALDSDTALLATIALHGPGIIQKVKQRPDMHLFEVTPTNREDLVEGLLF